MDGTAMLTSAGILLALSGTATANLLPNSTPLPVVDIAVLPLLYYRINILFSLSLLRVLDVILECVVDADLPLAVALGKVLRVDEGVVALVTGNSVI